MKKQMAERGRRSGGGRGGDKWGKEKGGRMVD